MYDTISVMHEIEHCLISRTLQKFKESFHSKELIAVELIRNFSYLAIALTEQNPVTALHVDGGFYDLFPVLRKHFGLVSNSVKWSKT